GPFAINLATFIGVKVGGATTLGVFGSILGAFIATFAVVLPSFIIIMVVTKLFDKFKTNKYVQYVLYGIKPIVVGLLLSAVLSILCKVVLPNLKLTAITKDGFSQFNWISLLIVCAFFPLSRVKIKGKRVHPIILIILSAVIGVVVFGAFGVTQ
ncbi:MAG: chromate transporter, partial [Clostridia bacterium]|nr:chromate transporter [Clostridia bacterium]